MGLDGNQVLLKKLHGDDDDDEQHYWVDISDNDNNVYDESRLSESSSMEMEDSTNSTESCSSSSDMAEDATSSSSSSSSLLLGDDANGPLYELSELMAQLPIKRGLSKFYQGKSQSHTSLASVKSVEDLAKKAHHHHHHHHHKTKMKSSKSYAWGLDVQKSCISKNKASRGSVLSSFTKKTGSFVAVSARDRLLTSTINIC